MTLPLKLLLIQLVSKFGDPPTGSLFKLMQACSAVFKSLNRTLIRDGHQLAALHQRTEKGGLPNHDGQGSSITGQTIKGAAALIATGAESHTHAHWAPHWPKRWESNRVATAVARERKPRPRAWSARSHITPCSLPSSAPCVNAPDSYSRSSSPVARTPFLVSSLRTSVPPGRGSVYRAHPPHRP